MTNQRIALTISALILWMGISVVACTVPMPSIPIVSATVTQIPLAVASTPTEPELSAPTPTAWPTPSPSSTPILTLASLYPDVVTICPSAPLVPLTKLGLESDTYLLVVPEEEDFYWDKNNVGLFLVNADSSAPQRIAAFSKEGQINSRHFLISPNGQWVIFQRKAKETDKVTTWIGSFDGKQQWPLSADERLENGSWLNDNTVILFDADDKIRQVLNPFTLEGEFLNGLPRMQVAGIGAKFFQYDDQTYLIYQSGDDYHLMDFSAQTDQVVLEWLRDDAADFLDKGIDILADGHIIIRVHRPYGVDISSPMSPDDLIVSQSYTQEMRSVVFPQAIMPVRVSPFSKTYPVMVLSGDTEDSRFYLFDYQRGVIRDYCFPLNGFSGISIDGKFAAFTRLHLPSADPVPKTTYILNLETGYFAQIDKYEFMGWAEDAK